MEGPLLTIVLAAIGWTIILTAVFVATFMAINNRFDTVNARIDSKFDAVNSRIDSLRHDMDARFDALRDLILQQGQRENARE